MVHVLRAVRMYRAFRGVLEERLKFKEEKNRDGTGRTITEKTEKGSKKELITQGLHLITTVLIILLTFLLYYFVCAFPVCVYMHDKLVNLKLE